MTPRTIPTLPAARALAAAALLALAACAAVRPAAAGVQVGVLPATVNVTPGAEFDVTIAVTQAGSPFNGFVAVVGYDPAALTFLPAASIATQQGCLMLGTCGGGCGNTFHRFTAAGDSLSITDHLMCDQLSLTGPGTIYTLRFRASSTAQVTWIRLRRATFYDAGLFVTPVETADARVGIGIPLAVEGTAPAPGLAVRAEPNPARGRLALAVESDRAGELRAEIHDLAGRLVRRLDGGWREAGAARLAWDGADGTGARVPPGVYLVQVHSGERVARARVVLVE